MDSLIATARSNKVATTFATQDFSQLKKDYGKEQADDSEHHGEHYQWPGYGRNIEATFRAFRKNNAGQAKCFYQSNGYFRQPFKQLDNAIPASKIASLSSGEFVGLVADNPMKK